LYTASSLREAGRPIQMQRERCAQAARKSLFGRRPRYRHAPGSLALREIRKYQKSTDTLIPKVRVVRVRCACVCGVCVCAFLLWCFLAGHVLAVDAAAHAGDQARPQVDQNGGRRPPAGRRGLCGRGARGGQLVCHSWQTRHDHGQRYRPPQHTTHNTHDTRHTTHDTRHTALLN
jgi:hypothetical protein